MEKSAIYHRPESEYAYLYKQDVMHIRLRTKKDDVKEVQLISGDPYLIAEDKWYNHSQAMKKLYTTAEFDYWFIETSCEFRRMQYGFHIIDIDSNEYLYGDRGIDDYNQETISRAEKYFRMPYFQEADRVKTPEWAKHVIWYQIFPERFANGNPSNDPKGTLAWASKDPAREDFFGGDLQGVLDHLDYLEELGITGIYFCPIFTAHSNHKYDTIDYYEIDPDFGDKELFKKVVAGAHQRGIRVMLDAVFNHMGYFSKQWQDVIENEEKSQYVDWFYIHSYPVEYGKNGNFEMKRTVSYDTFSFTPRMPKLNTHNPEVQTYLLDIATYWIKEFDIDAWRLDVANEVDHQFWKKFYHETTSIKEDFYILGEIWHSSQNWLNGDEFHAVMNYAYTETILDYFVHQTLKPTKMISVLYEQLMLYRQQTNEVMFNMLDSHDTARLLTLAEENKDLAKTTMAFTFIQHGAPCIYYGTEVGMTGHNDPDCRKCMIWEEEKQDLDFLQFTKELTKFRTQHADLMSYGSLCVEKIEGNENVIKVIRENETEKLVAYFSRTQESIALTVGQIENTFSLNADSTSDSIVLHGQGFLMSVTPK